MNRFLPMLMLISSSFHKLQYITRSIIKTVAILVMAAVLFLSLTPLVPASLLKAWGFISKAASDTEELRDLPEEEKEVLKDDLERQLQEVRNQIEKLREGLQKKNQQSKTLAGELKRLKNEIKRIELEIREVNLVINKTTNLIGEKKSKVADIEKKIADKKRALAEEVRTIYRQDNRNTIEILLSEESLSGFLSGLEALHQLQGRIAVSLAEFKSLKESLESEITSLNEEKQELANVRSLQFAQKQTLAFRENEREELLRRTKGEEAAFQRLITQAQQNADQIKNRIYVLEGGGQRQAFTLEEAHQHALFASEKTGVRPAFLMALVQQESNWGANVGTGNWREDMHPRDHDAFLKITSELGLDPDQTPVSAKPSYGWGGAIGPAQFLPQTWLAYRDRAAEILGRAPNPWDIRDAFLTAAIKLKAAGAARQNYDAEWKAAMIYFAGSRWDRPYYRFYGDQVMQKAQLIQDQLN